MGHLEATQTLNLFHSVPINNFRLAGKLPHSFSGPSIRPRHIHAAGGMPKRATMMLRADGIERSGFNSHELELRELQARITAE